MTNLANSGAAPAATAGARWFLIHSKPREDERALEHLQRQGFECYRPVRQVERLRSGRKFVMQEPLFPRYLFIHLDCVEDNWYPIRSTRGVHQIVRFNADPLPVRDAIIEGIRARLASVPVREPLLQPGEPVRINDGPFVDVDAIFLATEGDERVVVLLNMMQKEQEMVFPLRYIRKLA